MSKQEKEIEDRKSPFEPDEPIPETLRHKSLYALPYQSFDGLYEREWTDSQYISLGLAQWDSANDLSVKMLRFSYKDASRKKGEGKWSRQSEELPLHRPIDMVILTALALFENEDSETIPVPEKTFLRQEQPFEIQREKRHPLELRAFDRAWKEEAGGEDPNNPQSLKGVVKNRLRVLHKILDDLMKEGKL
ncbi:DUF6530 family protein [Thermodesulfobacteriota bacterium]